MASSRSNNLPFLCMARQPKLMRAPAAAALARFRVLVVLVNVVDADVGVGPLRRHDVRILIH